jgi:hypothetical protein
VRGLGGVADHEDDRVPAGDREDVGLLVVLDQADELLQLLEAQARLDLFVVRAGIAVSVMAGSLPTTDNVCKRCEIHWSC